MSSPATASPGVSTWNIDSAHTVADFKVRHMMISNVKGSIRGIQGVVHLDETDPSRSTFHATADLATLNTGEPQRDAHLKSADFFHHEQFPQITFSSTGVKRTGDEEFEVTGDLTIRGVTRPVKFAVEGLGATHKDPWGNLRVGLSATTKINRKDFGLSWNAALETGGVMVGEEVTISVEAEFVKAA
jgi:polyisoprenoid-binding protein YceI